MSEIYVLKRSITLAIHGSGLLYVNRLQRQTDSRLSDSLGSQVHYNKTKLYAGRNKCSPTAYQIYNYGRNTYHGHKTGCGGQNNKGYGRQAKWWTRSNTCKEEEKFDFLEARGSRPTLTRSTYWFSINNSRQVLGGIMCSSSVPLLLRYIILS